MMRFKPRIFLDPDGPAIRKRFIDANHVVKLLRDLVNEYPKNSGRQILLDDAITLIEMGTKEQR